MLSGHVISRVCRMQLAIINTDVQVCNALIVINHEIWFRHVYFHNAQFA